MLMDTNIVIRNFVQAIAVDPWRPTYRRRPIGRTPVCGWDARLDGYFWPQPGVDRHATKIALDPIVSLLQPLTRAVLRSSPWNAEESESACCAARLIFHWGRVPQRPESVTPENVRNVIEAAVRDDRYSNAPMNSGWTKLAALATAQLENPHVIWDSRVSTSIVRRLDRLFCSSGITEIPDSLNALGIVPGRGGSRPIRATYLHWPNGYSRWSSQVVASEFVRRVCCELNAGADFHGNRVLTERPGAWTVRDVEMVLFMDGY